MTNKQLDKEIERIYSQHGNGVQIGMMDIPRIFTAGHQAHEAGESIEGAILAAIAKYRRN